ncbi:MAG TPA: LLM class flavin-dependent oxidoreductase [Chloroflexota bacterium]|nr:LLM class flavin-dependent oxidoreductase [Chloroflexota bacterium]
MEFGVFSESGYRLNPVTAEAYDLDISEIIRADRLGFTEAWIAEPNHVRPNTVTDANLLICRLAAQTRRIRLGTAVRNLPLLHPINVVREANVCDHLTHGRYMFGYGGTRMQTMEQAHQRGLPFGKEETRAIVNEALELILRAWTATEPFDFEGRYWQATRVNVLPRPFQQPHPPIATACSGSAETLEFAGRHGFIPLLGRGNDRAEEIREWADVYLQAAEAAGRTPSRRLFHANHFVYVGENDRRAREDVLAGLSYVLERRKRETAIFLEKHIPPGKTIETVTAADMIESGYYWVGGPDTIAQRIADYFAESGGFGVLLMPSGLPVATPRKCARSMIRFTELVAPRVAHLDPDRQN